MTVAKKPVFAKITGFVQNTQNYIDFFRMIKHLSCKVFR